MPLAPLAPLAPLSPLAPLAPLVVDPSEPDLSSCVGLLPKPGCGTEPVSSGDRGGTMQIATFALMLAALLVIGARIARAVSARDRGA